MIDRRAFYDQRAAFRVRETGRYYQQLLRKQYAFWVPPGLRVLEVGCGLGDLLAAVKPARGVGVDFSPAMIALARQRHPELEFQVADAAEWAAAEKFDYILLADLVNDLPDVQAVFERLQSRRPPAHAAGRELLQQPLAPGAERWRQSSASNRPRCCKTGFRQTT